MSEFEWVAIAVVSILSTARLTRLLTWDKYPPVAWLRWKWTNLTNDGDWSELATCGYCASMYFAPAVLLSGYFTDFHLIWWLVNGSLATAYAAAVFMANDGDD